MKYKERLVSELRDLVIKITRLEVFLHNHSEDIEKEKIDLMNKQLVIMYEYLEILEQRIILEMKNN